MKAFRSLVLFLALAMLFAGCRSGKRASGPTGGYGSRTEQPGRVDYSSEETDGMGEDLAAEARRWLGTPYRYGGADRGGTDCSGLVMELYRSVCATRIPRTTAQQISFCTQVSRGKARVGDLMFFGPGRNPRAVSHVGLYIGRGEMIHASSSRGVMVSKVDAGYWGDRFCGVGRVDGAYNAWASINGVKKKGKKGGGRGNDTDPLLVPSPESPVPAPVMEIAYDRLPVQGGVELCDSAAADIPSPAVVASAGMQSVAMQQPEPEQAQISTSTVAGATASIDLLDLIINQKVDSIFTERFMD